MVYNLRFLILFYILIYKFTQLQYTFIYQFLYEYLCITVSVMAFVQKEVRAVLNQGLRLENVEWSRPL